MESDLDRLVDSRPPTQRQLDQLMHYRRRDGASTRDMPQTRDEASAEILKRRREHEYTIHGSEGDKKKKPQRKLSPAKEAEALWQEKVNAKHEELRRDFYARNPWLAPHGWTF